MGEGALVPVRSGTAHSFGLHQAGSQHPSDDANRFTDMIDRHARQSQFQFPAAVALQDEGAVAAKQTTGDGSL